MAATAAVPPSLKSAALTMSIRNDTETPSKNSGTPFASMRFNCENGIKPLIRRRSVLPATKGAMPITAPKDSETQVVNEAHQIPSRRITMKM